MGISLQRLTIPDDLVPNRPGYGNGQTIAYAEDKLSDICEWIGVTRLDHFIVDHCALVEQALEAAGWEEAELFTLKEVTGGDPEDADGFTTRHDEHGEPRRYAAYQNRAAYDAAQRWYDQIVQEVERKKPWFDPTEGLRTIYGLLDEIKQCIPEHVLIRAREKRVQRVLDAGVDRKWAEAGEPLPVITNFSASLWDLRTFELELRFAKRREDQFHFWVTY